MTCGRLAVHQNEYVTSDCDLKALAQKYGVPHSTIRKRSASEHWVEQREEHRNKVEHDGTKSGRKNFYVASEIATLKAKTRLTLWTEINRRMKELAPGMETADLRRMVQNYCDMISVEPGEAQAENKAKSEMQALADILRHPAPDRNIKDFEE